MNTIRDSAIIRQLHADEGSAYRSMRLESLRLHPTLFGTTYAEAAATPSLPFEHFIHIQEPDNVMFGAFVEQQICGICGFQREQRQRTRHRGELVHMYVAPRASKQGIGGRLIHAVVQYALQDPTVHQIVLSAVAENIAAISLYKRAGFREYGRLENYFRYDDISSTQVFMVYQRGAKGDAGLS